MLFYFVATSYQVTKKLGAASVQEDLIRNKEYFANLQRCYNPSVEFGDFTRSHSSNEVLGQPKIQEFKVQSSNSSSTRLLKRSHTCSALYTQGQDTGQSVATFSKIIEEREGRRSLIEDTEKVREEKRFSESSSEGEDEVDEDIDRTQSIQKLRGILESKFKSDYATVHNIKFRLEDPDKIEDQREFPRLTKRILRSPTTRDFYLRHRLTTPTFSSPPPKSKAHLCFCTNVSSQRLTPEYDSSKYKLKQNNQIYESSINDSDKAKKVLGLLPKYLDSPKLSSTTPEDVELPDLERKSIQNRLSVKPTLSRFFC